jgi:hypothetical protein
MPVAAVSPATHNLCWAWGVKSERRPTWGAGTNVVVTGWAGSTEPDKFRASQRPSAVGQSIGPGLTKLAGKARRMPSFALPAARHGLALLA